MPGTRASPLPSRRETLNASSKPVAYVAPLISLETPTGMTTSMIFCGMLLPLLALEISRPEGLTEDSFELQSSAIIAGVFRCGLIPGECMREFHPSLSAITKDVPLSLSGLHC